MCLWIGVNFCFNFILLLFLFFTENMYLNSYIEAVHFFSDNGFLSFSFFHKKIQNLWSVFTEILKGSVNLFPFWKDICCVS